MREVMSVLLIAVLGVSCLDAAADAAVAMQERDRAEARVLRAEAAAVRSEEAADGAEWSAVQANAARDVACSCTWSLVKEDPDYHGLLTRMPVLCHDDACTIQRVAVAEVPPHEGEP